MIITNGVGYVHIQKTAGTSIRQAMMMSGPTFYVGKIIEPKEDIGSHSNKFNAHFNPSELASILKNLFTFTCVRNPWDRLVSWYAYRKDGRTFEAFVKQLYGLEEEDSQRDKKIPKNSPIQGDYFKGIEYDLVLQFESIKIQWAAIQKKLGISVELRKMNPSNHKPYRKYYTPELIHIVADKENYVI